MVLSSIKHYLKEKYTIRSYERTFSHNYNFAKRFLLEYPQKPLVDRDKKQIDAYWKQYGISFKDYSWFQMYYGITNIHDPRFIPDPIAGYVLYNFYNNHLMIKGWDDKNFYQKLCPAVVFPDALCHCVEGKLYDKNWNFYSRDNIKDLSISIFENTTSREIIVKESRNTDSGRGVMKYKINCSSDIERIIRSNISSNYIIQNAIHQHKFLSQFNESSVNIFRIVSWRRGGEIVTFPASIRYGIQGSITDVSFIDSQEIVNVVGINDDGLVKSIFVCLQGKQTNPIKLKEYRFEKMNELLEIVKEAHKCLPLFDIIGWDFTVDDNDNFICIEYNLVWPGTVLYQFANGPFAGDMTDSFLAVLKNSEQINRIPKSFRCDIP